MSMMRRFTLVLLALATVLSLASCNIYIVENMNGMGTQGGTEETRGGTDTRQTAPTP